MDNILIYAVLGFIAQMIDGSLGMGYKVSSSAFLLSIGVPPVIASASVHTAGVFTSAASGLSHYRFGNFNFNLIRQLAIFGILGGILGAVLLTHLPTHLIKPLVATYLLLMGLRIVLKSFRRNTNVETVLQTRTLGFVGGFFDAIGGGGWGPIVTSTLMMRGYHPRYVIGSVNISEWFVTFIQATTFILLIGNTLNFTIIGGMILGGVIAAPIAAYVCQRLPIQRLMLLVGLLITVLSARTLFLALFA